MDDSKSVLIDDVPFVVQAPYRNWDDLMYQDGCEEASLIIAYGWVTGEKKISAVEANERIKRLSDFEQKTYGFYLDVSAADTARTMRDFYGHEAVAVRYDVTAPDIIAELQNGNVVIVPMNGQVLDNPYLTGDGPERHMLVIIGWDARKREFITNDPGTRRGEGFRYREDNFMASIRDYPSGYGVPITEERTAMIVVGK